MRVLLDTCVISENLRPDGEPRVKERVRSLRSQDTYLSALTIGEIARGVALLESGRRRDGLSEFLLGLERDFADRILGIDAEIAHVWGEASAKASRAGRTIPAVDGLIAATAVRHGLRVLTRNVRDFEGTGALILDPWDGA